MGVSRELALEFESLRESHIPSLLAIEEEAYPDPWTATMLRQEITNGASHFYIGTVQAELAGYGGFWLVVDEAHITKVTIAPIFRGRRLGYELLEYLLGVAREAGANTARLEVRESNDIARRLYVRMGFRAVGIRRNYYARAQESAVVMSKKLGPE